MRLFLSSMTLGVGYLLVYAAFHPDGPAGRLEYVRRPWRSLFAEQSAGEAELARLNAAQDAAAAQRTALARVRRTEFWGAAGMKPAKVIGATEGLALLAAAAGDLADQKADPADPRSPADPTLPSPRAIVGILGFYGLLGLLSNFGEGPARLAAAAGVVTFLASLVLPGAPAGKHLVSLLETAAEL